MTVFSCRVCSGIGQTRKDWYPSPVWDCCPACSGTGESVPSEELSD